MLQMQHICGWNAARFHVQPIFDLQLLSLGLILDWLKALFQQR